jgi:hypothetical protein
MTHYDQVKSGRQRILALRDRVAEKIKRFMTNGAPGEDQYSQTVAMLDCANIRIKELTAQA